MIRGTFATVSALLLVASIAIADAKESKPLTLGVPYNGRVDEDGWDYFKVDVSEGNVLDVLVTPFNGDPDIFGDFAEFPDQSHSQWQEQLWGGDGLSIPDFEGHTTVYFGVTGVGSPSDYTITASYQGEPIQLENGYPQFNTIPSSAGHTMQYYTFNMTAFPDAVEVAFGSVSFSGYPQVFVSGHSDVKPEHDDPTTYQWKTDDWIVGQTLIVRKKEAGAHWPSDLTFSLGVFGGGYGANYSLTATVANTHQILQDGHPVRDHLLTGESEFFEFIVPKTGCNLTIQVTPMSGDPDLYVSSPAQQPHQEPFPDPDHPGDYRGFAYGEDEVYIATAPKGSYYIGVNSFMNCTFTLVGSLLCHGEESFIWLQDGVPQQRELGQERWDYFRFPVNSAHEDITISVGALEGDPDLYINLGEVFPTEDDADFVSRYYGRDLVHINHHEHSLAGVQVLSIMIKGFTDTRYTVMARSDNRPAQLRSGVPLRDHLEAQEWAKFVIEVRDDTHPLTITVTALERGDPDMYVGVGFMPNKSHNTWSSIIPGSDAYTISPEDLRDYGMPVEVYVGVYGFLETDFIIMGTFDNATQLLPGYPQFDTVVNGETDYFTLLINGDMPGNTTVTISTQAGLTQSFASCSNHFPTLDSHEWYFQPYLPVAVLYLTEEEVRKHGCSWDKPFVIGVRGYLGPANFTIMATDGDGTTMLMNGVAQRMRVGASQWKYMLFRVAEPHLDLIISTTPFNGEPDLCVTPPPHPHGVDPRPTGDCKNANRSARFGSDWIEYTNAAVGDYYIGVYGWLWESSFSVMALAQGPHDDHDVITLDAGVPVMSQVFKGHNRTFRFHFEHHETHTKERLLIQLSDQFGECVPCVALNRVPTMNTCEWEGQEQYLDSIDIQDPEDGFYYIVVYGTKACGFHLLVSVDQVELQSGTPFRGYVAAHETQEFFLRQDSFEYALTFTITPFSGVAYLYVVNASATDETHATPENYYRKIEYYYGGSFTLRPQDLPCRQINPPCIYYASVVAQGDTGCSFSLSASYDYATFLFEGSSQLGHVPKFGMTYYAFYQNEHTAEVSISLTVLEGNAPRVYASTDTYPTTKVGEYMWVSPNDWTGEPWDIPLEDTKNCHGMFCSYYLGVYGRTSNASYMITVTTRYTSVLLTKGVPLRRHVEKDDTVFFYYPNYEPGKQVAFLVTAIEGDPDLYAATSYEFPTRAHHEFSSSHLATDALVFEHANYTHPYNLGVFAYQNSTFTILVDVSDEDEISSDVRMQLGQPQDGTVAHGVMRYYIFELNEDVDAVLFTCTRRFGDPDLYLNINTKRPTKDVYQYKAAAAGEDYIRVAPAPKGKYYIGVYGFSAHGAFYSVLTSSEGVLTTLQAGVPLQRALGTDEVDYFVLPVQSSGLGDLTVALTAGYGDPDIFISQNYSRPDSAHSEWSGVLLSDDSITIPDAEQGNYYIAVRAWQGCFYTIIASFRNGSLLVDGQPQYGAVLREATLYYHYFMPKDATSFSVTAVPMVGRPFFFMSTKQRPIPWHTATYEWSAVDYYAGSQSVFTDKTNKHWCDECTWYIAVYGGAVGTTKFSLMASNDQSDRVLLLNGVPQESEVAKGLWKYYVLIVPNKDSDVSISVTPVTGDPDLYISYVNPYPNEKDNNGSSRYAGPDTVRIFADDRKFHVGNIYISVFGYTNSQFTIMALASGQHHNASILLVDGVPQSGSVATRGAYAYFEFSVDFEEKGNKEVVFTVEPTSDGDPDLYINKDGNHPDKGHYEWRGMMPGADRIVIDSTNGACVKCTYDVAVYGYHPTDFIITVSTNDAVMQLLNGVSANMKLEQGGYAYFKVLVDETHSELTVVLTALNGDPDLYADNDPKNQHPNSTHYHSSSDPTEDWRSTSFGDDFWWLESPAAGVYYLGVRAFQRTEFSITAYVSGERSATSLQNGRPLSDMVLSGQSKAYTFRLAYDKRKVDLFVRLQNLAEGQAKMYISTSVELERGHFPTKEHKLWSSEDAHSSTIHDVVRIAAIDENYCQDCSYFISVEADVQSSYSISYSANFSHVLVDGRGLEDFVPKNEYNYYRFLMPDGGKDITVAVTPYSGRTRIFLSTTESRPTLAKHNCSYPTEASSEGYQMVIKYGQQPAHEQCGWSAGNWYMSVFGAGEQSAYQIVVSTQAIQLIAGQPLQGKIEEEAVNYFFRVDETKSVTLALQGITQADERFEVSVSTSVQREKVLWHTYMGNAVPFTMKATDEGFCENCEFFVKVEGGTVGHTFRVELSFGGTVRSLVDGSRVHGVVQGNTYTNFEMFAYSVNNFTVTLEPCSHNADLFADTDTFYPTKGRSNWESQNKARVDVIAPYHNFENTNIYIGVLGIPAEGETADAGVDFIISSRFSDTPEKRPEIPKAEMTVGTLQVGKIWLKFNAAGDLEAKQGELEYQVFYSTLARAVLYTECGVDHNDTGVQMFAPFHNAAPVGEEIKISLDGFSSTKDYHVNVRVKDKLGRVNFYEQLKVNAHVKPELPSSAVSMKTVLAVGVPLFVLVVAVVTYLCARNRRLTKELAVELHDVPKSKVRTLREPTSEAAATEEAFKRAKGFVAARPSTKSKKYSRLLTEESSESEGEGTYYPPGKL